jgi:glycosyltransferase involved in cell wall biosynthesis
MAQLLQLLAAQTLRPSVVIVSATGRTDVESDLATRLNVEYIFGPAGTCIQRNRGLEQIRSACDIVIFFDDDFAPCPHWIERCAHIFRADESVVGTTGVLLRDGAQLDEVSWEEAMRLIGTSFPAETATNAATECKDLYGCNMAYRMSAIGESSFDERLVLYGWMEDADFSRTVGRKGRLMRCGAMVGVHLGIKSGRMSGKRYGYSQVVNPWYLHRKGTLSVGEACSKSLLPLLMNAAKTIRPEKHIDRLGRFGGNIIGIGHLLTGHCRPEQAAEL